MAGVGVPRHHHLRPPQPDCLYQIRTWVKRTCVVLERPPYRWRPTLRMGVSVCTCHHIQGISQRKTATASVQVGHCGETSPKSLHIWHLGETCSVSLHLSSGNFLANLGVSSWEYLSENCSVSLHGGIYLGETCSVSLHGGRRNFQCASSWCYLGETAVCPFVVAVRRNLECVSAWWQLGETCSVSLHGGIQEKTTMCLFMVVVRGNLQCVSSWW